MSDADKMAVWKPISNTVLLSALYRLCLSDHMGDAMEAMEGVFKHFGLKYDYNEEPSELLVHFPESYND